MFTARQTCRAVADRKRIQGNDACFGLKMHKCFDVICGRRCPAVAEHAVAFRGNQHVVFDAYSTETEILANFGKIDEASAETFLSHLSTSAGMK